MGWVLQTYAAGQEAEAGRCIKPWHTGVGVVVVMVVVVVCMCVCGGGGLPRPMRYTWLWQGALTCRRCGTA